MPQLLLDQLADYRAQTFHTRPGLRLASAEDAVRFVNERGFVFFWPIKNVLLPSIWVAAAGDRPVPNEHDDPGHVTWGWKDDLLGKRRWYYGRVLRKRNAMLSLAALPYFYALSPNYGDPENDYLLDYEQGTMTLEARNIYEALLKNGPLDTLEIRRRAHLTNTGSDTLFNRALDDLMMTFKVLPVGISQSGAWHYAFIYDLTAHHFPDLIERAHAVSEAQARRYLLELYFYSVGAAQWSDLHKLFGWRPVDTQRAVAVLQEEGLINQGVEYPGGRGEWIALRQLLQ